MLSEFTELSPARMMAWQLSVVPGISGTRAEKLARLDQAWGQIKEVYFKDPTEVLLTELFTIEKIYLLLRAGLGGMVPRH